MKYSIPKVLVDFLADESWSEISPDDLRRCLGSELDDLQLYESVELMLQVSANLDSAGYVDDPEFCMTREQGLAPDDPRLEFPRALFIGGSTVPGDDVFVAIQQEDSEDYDPPVLVLDWRKEVPSRWTERGKLSELLDGIGMQC
ncbi:MAG: hypothetical protein AAFP90_05780 [Planctomycetota bacterium]